MQFKSTGMWRPANRFTGFPETYQKSADFIAAATAASNLTTMIVMTMMMMIIIIIIINSDNT